MLFVYPELMLGGSTTSLISLLKSIDYEHFEVDLVLYRNRGAYFNDLPSQVTVLPEVSSFNASFLSICRKLLYFIVSGIFLRAFFVELFYKKKIGFNSQIMCQFQARHSRKVEKKYDIAIGYLELWADYYTLEKVLAQRKLIWIHTDYVKAGFIPSLDEKRFKKADQIVCVSESCLISFNEVFPNLAHKVVVLENILSSDYVRQRATEPINFNDDLDTFTGIKFVTVCRLTMHTKGLDRSIAAAKKLKADGYHFRWFIVGDGEDFKMLENLIQKEGLKDTFFLIGKKINPYPYIQKCDVYVMASRREGKPMSVTEAQILGLPIIVTNYSSAKEQVVNGEDGIIVENTDEAIYGGMKAFLDNPTLSRTFKENLLKKELNNVALIEKFYSNLE